MENFFSNDLEIILTIILTTFFMIFFYDKFRNHGKLYLNIFKMKIDIINSNTNWLDTNKKLDNNTKYVDINFNLQLYNHKNTNNSIYNLNVLKKVKRKYQLTEYHNLNLTDSCKTISGSTSYEKIKYINILPYEVKEYRLKIKLTKEEYLNLKHQPLYIQYKNHRKTRLLKLNKYLKSQLNSLKKEKIKTKNKNKIKNRTKTI